jgi:hypothetical protein
MGARLVIRPLPSWSTDIAVVIVVLATGGGTAVGVSHGTLRAQSAPSGLDAVPSPTLSVDPPSWWMLAGVTTSISATWTGVPGGCSGWPLWYRWGIRDGFAAGALNPSDGPEANFTAGAEQSGVAQVEVRSALAVSCGSVRNTVLGEAVTSLTVVAPLSLQNLSISPNPLPSGAVANLSVRVVNGQPPYLLRVKWGDGTSSLLNVTKAGFVSLPHRFTNGSYNPAVFASDSAGMVENASVEEPLSVSGGLAVALDPSTIVAEVGIPVGFSGVVLHAPAEFGYVTSCTDSVAAAATHDAATPAEVSFNCTFEAPGIADVDFEVVPVGGDLPPVEAQLAEPVEPPLELNVSPPSAVGEVGHPTVLAAAISGGVAPFRIAWRLTGNSSTQVASCYTDGTVALPVWPAEAGSYVVSVSILDAVGAQVENSSANLPVNPPLEASASIDRVLSSSGGMVAVTGAVSSGTPPFDWWVIPAVATSNESPGNGSLRLVGAIAWNGTFDEEGNTSVSVFVVDGEGAEWSTSLPVSLVPVLNVTAQTTGSSIAGGRSILLNVSVEGGLPPFEAYLSSGDNETWSRTMGWDGSFSWVFPTNDTGRVGLRLLVRDGLGTDWAANESVNFPSSDSSIPQTPPVPPGPSAATRTPDSGREWAALGIALLLALVGGVVLVRRRRARSIAITGPKPDPVDVVRRIVEPAEGAERSTVELLAEEAGVSLEVVRSTIDRLISEGRLRAESSVDGEEVLAWSDGP